MSINMNINFNECQNVGNIPFAQNPFIAWANNVWVALRDDRLRWGFEWKKMGFYLQFSAVLSQLSHKNVIKM